MPDPTRESPPSADPRACQYVVGYQREPAGSDVADPRIRCGEPATERIDGDVWLCPQHAKIYREEQRREASRNG